MARHVSMARCSLAPSPALVTRQFARRPHTSLELRQAHKRKLACGSTPPAAPDTEDIMSNIAHQFAMVQQPAKHNIRYSAALQVFCESVILAYECGYSESDVLLNLTKACDTSAPHVSAERVRDCIECVCIVWLTLELASKSVKRWSTLPPVTQETTRTWTGFVTMIVNAYFDRRMAAYPVDRLQAELAVMGRVEPHDTVSEWSRIVFETLHHVSPQFARD